MGSANPRARRRGKAAARPSPAPVRSPDDLVEHIKDRSPDVYITLVSIVVGMVLADLVTEARARMHLWPADALAIRTWAQIMATTASALTTWAVYAHLGISRRSLPWYGETLAALIAPLILLFGNTYVGRPELWPWLYLGALLLGLGGISYVINVRLTVAAEGPQFNALLRPFGALSTMYFGTPLYLAAGVADQLAPLPAWAGLALCILPIPAAAAVALLFFRDWRRALGQPTGLFR